MSDDTQPSIRVIATVAEALEVAPVDCQPLYEIVDLPTLEELFCNRPFSNEKVSIDYAGFRVMIDDEVVELTKQHEDRSSNTRLHGESETNCCTGLAARARSLEWLLGGQTAAVSRHVPATDR